MFKIVIHDSNSSLRMRLESRRESPLMLMRGIINEAIMPGRLTVWAWDGKGGNDRRRAIFKDYKRRPPTPNQMHINLGLLRELLSYTPAWQAKIDGFEGDDMVAALVEEFYGKADLIEIITKDGDLTALCRPGVVCKAKADAPPELIRLYKLTVGDSSDTIPGIRGFGPKDWEAADKVALRGVLETPGFTDEAARAAGLRPPHIRWLREHPDLLSAMRQIIEPMPMTPAEFNSALSQGTDNPEAREAIMKRLML